MNAKFTAFVGLLLSAGVAQAAPIDLITNGSFELGSDPGTFTTVNAGGSAISGWTVGLSSVDYIGSYWTAQDGSRSIDLSGNAPGSLSQTVSDVAGQSYLLTFWIAGNPDGDPTVKHIDIGVKPSLLAPVTYSFDVTGHSKSSMGWVQRSVSFTGTGSDTITFASGDDSPYGPALDNVSLSAVPLPASLPLFGGALLALAGFGYGLNRWVAPKAKTAG